MSCNPDKDTILLKDEAVFPSDSVLARCLGRSFSAYGDLFGKIERLGHPLKPEWKYYRDGKAWLCRVSHKKKTVFWLSVWEGYFRVSFYFTEKNRKDIGSLDIDPGIKTDFVNAKSVGKLLPLVVHVRKKSQIRDTVTLAEYRIGK